MREAQPVKLYCLSVSGAVLAYASVKCPCGGLGMSILPAPSVLYGPGSTEYDVSGVQGYVCAGRVSICRSYSDGGFAQN